MTKPSHLDTVELTPAQMERGMREERYRQQLKAWRDDEISDATWEHLRSTDREFKRWLWRLGM